MESLNAKRERGRGRDETDIAAERCRRGLCAECLRRCKESDASDVVSAFIFLTRETEEGTEVRLRGNERRRRREIETLTADSHRDLLTFDALTTLRLLIKGRPHRKSIFVAHPMCRRLGCTLILRTDPA